VIVIDASAVVTVLRRRSLSGQLDPPCRADDHRAGEATDVALAVTLECPLLTSDRRLARAVGPSWLIQLVPG
jgi:predicted nucleic acid-binding protein